MTAKWGGIEMATKNDSSKNDRKANWLCDSGTTIHRSWYSRRGYSYAFHALWETTEDSVIESRWNRSGSQHREIDR